MSGERNRMTVSNNVFHGSQVFTNGGRPRIDVRHAGSGAEELRAALGDARDVIVAAGRDGDERGQLDADVRALDRELGREEPRPAVVTGRWDAIRALLGQALTHSAEIARVAEIVANHFPG